MRVLGERRTYVKRHRGRYGEREREREAERERERERELRKVQTVWKCKPNKRKGGASQLKAPDAYGWPRVSMPPRTDA